MNFLSRSTQAATGTHCAVALDARLGEMVENDLCADIVEFGTLAGERSGQIKVEANLDLLSCLGGRGQARR